LTDAAGIPVGLAVAGANRVDFKLAEETLESIPINRPQPSQTQPQGMCLDKGYDYVEVILLLILHEFTPHVRTRGQEIADKQNIPDYHPRRWVVERTHSWINRFRRLLIRWEKKVANYKALLHLAFACIIFQKSSLLG
jgi:hypothetical protein